MPNKLIIAHRGAPKLARENTLMAFQKAIDLGADIIELDVRQTKDGKLAVFHDPDITGQKIKNISFFKLQKLAKTKNFQVPTLAQALRLISGKADLQIEIKDLGYEFKTVETALKYLKPKNFYIISFNFEVLKKIKSRYPKINTGLIIGSWKTCLWQMLDFLINKKEILSTVNQLCINIKLWQAGFGKLMPKKFPITIWAVDKPDILGKLLKDRQIQAITSNVPDVALKLRKKIYAP